MIIECYLPANFAEPGDNDSLEVANSIYNGPGYASGGQSATNSHYTMYYTITDVPLTVEDSADLATTKSCAPDPVKAGNPFTCTIEVTNAGPGLPRAVQVLDTITTPVSTTDYTVSTPTLTFEGTSASPANDACQVSSGSTIVCQLGSVPLSPAKAVITYAVNSDEGGTFTNTATVSSASSDPNPGNNSATDSVTVIPQSDLVITKTADPSPVLAGGELTYAVSSKNEGPSTAQNVQIVDTLPAETLFLSATPSTPGTCTTPSVGGTGQVTCTWSGPTSTSDIRSVTIVVEVGGPGTILNGATTSSTVEDPDPTNNNVSVATEIICTIYGTEGNDVLTGTDGFDVICGLGGNDTIHSLEGDDRIFGGEGDDRIDGGPGADKLHGENGHDQLQGGTGDDKLFGEAGNDQLHGGQGIDQLHGGVDEDVCTDPANEAGTKTACEKP
jgi:uncharacterized repeat protein (TIGR01451 family)